MFKLTIDEFRFPVFDVPWPKRTEQFEFLSPFDTTPFGIHHGIGNPWPLAPVAEEPNLTVDNGWFLNGVEPLFNHFHVVVSAT